MTNLFAWLLRRFMIAFAVLVAVQLAVYVLGLGMILSGYEDNRLEQYEDIAEQILTGTEPAQTVELPGINPFFVFSTERELVFSNRGKGKSISTEEIQPVYSKDRIVGYFHAGELGFADNQANRIFLTSIIILSILSVVLSIIIGFLAAWFSSRRISTPVSTIKRDIHDIRSLKQVPSRSFSIAELTDISHDVAEASEALRSQEEYKRQWLRDLSHDLRTPLAGLKSQLEAMADGVLEPSVDRFRRHLLEIERLEELAASIGELTAIEARESIVSVRIDAARFAELLTDPYEMELKQKNVELETSVTAEYLTGDEQLLLRAVGNILSNALKFIDGGDRIWLNISDKMIEIANNGPDIPEEQRELIFSRLYRGDSGRTTPGSGLGLSIAREIIKLHGGMIRAEQLEIDGVKTRGVRFIINF